MCLALLAMGSSQFCHRLEQLQNVITAQKASNSACTSVQDSGLCPLSHVAMNKRDKRRERESDRETERNARRSRG